jgi:hypothetical protein
VCFSATASFSAAAALSGIGAVSLSGVRSPKAAPLAAIPLLFAAQQACEGAVWLVLDRAPFHVASTPLARAFLFFAVLVWPAYVPFALALVEPVRQRRLALFGCLAAGIALGLYLMGCVVLRDSNACIAFGNLYYWVQVDGPLKRLMLLLYLATVAGSLFLSSKARTSWLAVLVMTSFTATALLYRAGFASVWCFFAALISGAVAVVVRRDCVPPRALRALTSLGASPKARPQRGLRPPVPP